MFTAADAGLLEVTVDTTAKKKKKKKVKHTAGRVSVTICEELLT